MTTNEASFQEPTELERMVMVRQPWPRGVREYWARLGYTTCVFPGCGVSVDDCHRDHVIPVALGGESTPRNSQPLCPFHNGLKGDMPLRWWLANCCLQARFGAVAGYAGPTGSMIRGVVGDLNAALGPEPSHGPAARAKGWDNGDPPGAGDRMAAW